MSGTKLARPSVICVTIRISLIYARLSSRIWTPRSFTSTGSPSIYRLISMHPFPVDHQFRLFSLSWLSYIDHLAPRSDSLSVRAKKYPKLSASYLASSQMEFSHTTGFEDLADARNACHSP